MIRRVVLFVLFVSSLLAAASPLTKIRLQLQWFAQTQFAGYYAAASKGFYEREGLKVAIQPGANDIVPQDQVSAGKAEFCIAWLPKVLVSMEQGNDLVNIAQIFQRNATLEISWKDRGIHRPEDWKGKKIGTWGYGNEIGLFAAMRKVGIDPDNPKDVTIVKQRSDMKQFLAYEIDAAQAMTYNEYFEVLQSIDPKTGKNYIASDLNVISMEQVGTGMPQDGIYTSKKWLNEKGHEEIAVRFLRASFQGWIYCRDHASECVDIVLSNNPKLNKERMEWMMQEVNKLIWPSPAGIGQMDKAHWKMSATILQQARILKHPPSNDAYRSDLAASARKGV
jgi:NitT/TauT family transport system substrate-binding protein